jgi:hypothetical protein
MGFYICEKHGRQGSPLICPHLETAVREDKPLAFSAVTYDDILVRYMEFCEPCKNLWSGMDADGRESFLDTVTSVCGACFDEWKAKHSTPAMPVAT